MKLKAYIANIKKKINHWDYPVKTFGNANRYPNPHNQLDPQDQWNPCSQQDIWQDQPGGYYNLELPNQGVCFKYRQPGHFRDQCRNQAIPYKEEQEQVNTIQESYLSGYSDDYSSSDKETDF